MSGSWSGMGWGTSQCFDAHSLSLLLLELLKCGLSDSAKEGQWWKGSFPPWNTFEKSFASDGKHLSVPSSHPWSREGRICVTLDPQGPHPSPGDFIPLLVSFSWHLQGLHPIHSILLLAFPGTASLSLSWHLQGLHPVLMQLKMSLLIARSWTR